MKAYEALALGRHLVRPQGGVVLTIYYDLRGEQIIEGCALGMIQQGAGNEEGERLRKWLLDTLAICPCGCYLNSPRLLQDCVTHLFDQHIMRMNSGPYEPWTLDQLIDWLKTQEPEMEPKETNECTEETRALVAHS